MLLPWRLHRPAPRSRAGSGLLLLALAGGTVIPRPAAGQQPSAADTVAAADTLRPPARAARADTLPAGGVAHAPPPPARSVVADTLPIGGADSLASADSLALADSAAAARADSAAADTLARVQAEIEQARQRLHEVRETLQTIPEEDRLRRSPRGAVLRAFALPGWGQFYTGHKVRGLFYAGAELGFATLGFLKQREVLDLNDEIMQAKLDFVASEEAAHPDSAFSLEDTLALYDRFESTPEGASLLSSLESKKKRREDYFTYSIFSVLFSAIDAFVTAHLEPFEDARFRVSPGPDRWRLDMSVPLGGDEAGGKGPPEETARP